MTEAVSKIILNDEAFNENTLKVGIADVIYHPCGLLYQ